MSRISSNAFPVNYRPVLSKTLLYEYIEERLRASQPGQSLEIETRLGSYLSARPLTPEMLDASLQAPLILSARTAGPLRKMARSLSQFVGNFEPALPSDRFYLAAEACARVLGHVSPTATVDFILRDSLGTRITWDLNTNKTEESTKSGKESIDLVHQGRQYRLATSFEKSRLLSSAEFDELLAQNKCGLIRLKLRETTCFQFMRFCCTRCLSTDKGTVKAQLLALFRHGDQSLVEKVKKILQENEANETLEVENEIGDAEFLRNTLRDPRTRADFPAFIDRFLRNTELLDMITKSQMNETGRTLLREWAGEEVQPVVGSYLYSLLGVDLG